MKIGVFSDRDRIFIGGVFNEQVFDFSAASLQLEKEALPDLGTIFRQERFDSKLFHHLFMLGQYRQEFWLPLGFLSFVPLYRPDKIICLGLNYSEHARETAIDLPKEPIYFVKANSAVIAHEQPIMYPDGLGRIDPEAELAVIIGRRAKEVTEEEAAAYIGGYTILNDVTARDLQAKDIQNKHPWFRSKSLDTFCPIGPWIVTANEILPDEPLKLSLSVNGEVRQNSSTKYLVFKISSLISTISALMVLEPGDIISTGTPEGIAPIYPGDVVEIEVEKIGILRNGVEKKKVS
ncbi:MAG TPA: fumarylacetoacetate hydrolase family protein [Syntrophorhabdales bacterium]|nr:fumarylacetoacetate hydrolase family protein [Syntrophorhabdales bacterium]